MGSGDNFTTNISALLHTGMVKEAYRSTNKVNYIKHMLKHNDQCTGLDYMEESLSYLAFQDWYNIDSRKVFNQPSAADKRRNTRRAHPLHFHHCQKEPFFRPISQQVGSLPSSSIVSPQRPPTGASGSSPNGLVQVLLQLCFITISGQIDLMYICRDLNNTCHNMM